MKDPENEVLTMALELIIVLANKSTEPLTFNEQVLLDALSSIRDARLAEENCPLCNYAHRDCECEVEPDNQHYHLPIDDDLPF